MPDSDPAGDPALKRRKSPWRGKAPQMGITIARPGAPPPRPEIAQAEEEEGKHPDGGRRLPSRPAVRCRHQKTKGPAGEGDDGPQHPQAPPPPAVSVGAVDDTGPWAILALDGVGRPPRRVLSRSHATPDQVKTDGAKRPRRVAGLASARPKTSRGGESSTRSTAGRLAKPSPGDKPPLRQRMREQLWRSDGQPGNRAGESPGGVPGVAGRRTRS